MVTPPGRGAGLLSAALLVPVEHGYHLSVRCVADRRNAEPGAAV